MMMSRKSLDDDAAGLRGRADESVHGAERGAKEGSTCPSLEEIRHRLDELSVRRTELEMSIERLGRAQEAFRDGHQLFRGLYDNMTSGVAIYRAQDDGADFVFTDVNAAGLRIVGLERSDVVGRTLTDLFPTVRAMGLLDTLRRVWRTGEAETLPGVQYTDSRISQWFANRVFRIPSGEVVALYDDLTQTKQSEGAVTTERQLLRTVIDNLPVSIYAKDLEGRKTLANRSDLERMGLATEEEALGKTDFDLYPHDRASDYSQDDQRVLRTGIPMLNEERVRVTSEGGREWRLGTRVPLADGAGKIIGLVGISQDITARKLAEEALQESEERFRTLIEAAPEGIFVHSDGRLVFANPAYCSMMGASQSGALLGASCLDQVAPECHEAFTERTRVGQETGEAGPSIELELVRQDGSRIPVDSTAVPVRYKGKTSHLVFVRDITGRKRREQERSQLDARLARAQRLESTGLLAGGIAHDFNNMLGVILAYVDIALGRYAPGQPTFTDLQEIRGAAQHCADLTQQLLGFAGRQTFAPIALDLNELVDDMLDTLRHLTGENLTVTWRPGPTPCTIKIDPAQLNQILVNLCLDRRDATGGVGELAIETGTIVLDQEYCARHGDGCDPGEYVVLTVRDDGGGEDEETLGHLFEPFHTSASHREGTGLRLATVHGIVLQNGGSIDVVSESGRGTTFRTYLPLQALEPGHLPERVLVAPASRGYETVLVVDDEPAVLTGTAALLARQGYTVLAAHTPREALRIAEEHTAKIDLLLTDVAMPEMNGRELAREIVSIHPITRCLYMSGYSSDVIERRGMLGAGVSFIGKPFTLRDLAVKVRQVLDEGTPQGRIV
jgi:two-component system cell cycle sensor histidine kinase/response regulator CckA